jgi:uncharacterized membrane protein YqhA
MFKVLLQARYLFIIAVVFLLLNSVIFLIVGAVKTVHGYMEFIEIGFKPTGDVRPGLYILGGFDAFMIAMVCLIFGLGTARIFIYDKLESDRIPGWLNVHNIKETKGIVYGKLYWLPWWCSALRRWSDIHRIHGMNWYSRYLFSSFPLPCT